MEAAIWIKETDRLDLVGNWFSAREAEVDRYLRKAEVLAYGGLDEGNTAIMPGDLLEQVKSLHQRARFIASLARNEALRREDVWTRHESKSGVAMLLDGVQRKLSMMDHNLSELASLQGTIERLLCEVNKAITGSASAGT